MHILIPQHSYGAVDEAVPNHGIRSRSFWAVRGVLVGVVFAAASVALLGFQAYSPRAILHGEELAAQNSIGMHLEVFNEYTQHKAIVWAKQFWPHLAEPYRETTLVAITGAGKTFDTAENLVYEWIIDGTKSSHTGQSVTHEFTSVGYHEVSPHFVYGIGAANYMNQLLGVRDCVN
jgi:hypothetical protein